MIWLLRNWKLVALILTLLALFGSGVLIYQKGKAQARLEHQVETLTKRRDFWKEWAETSAEALAKHTERAQEDASKIASLTDRITDLNEYVETLEDRDRVCLSDPDVERLRDLWNDPATGPTSSASR